MERIMFTRLKLSFLIFIVSTVFSASSNAVVLYIDDWKNHAHHSYYFKKTDDTNFGRMHGPNGSKDWQDNPKNNSYVHLFPYGQIHSTGFAIPWYKNGNSKFSLHRAGHDTVQMWIGGCGEWDCLYARNASDLTDLKGFPTKVGPKGTCMVSMSLVIEKNGDVKFIPVDDKLYECGVEEKIAKDIGKTLLDLAPVLAAGML
jgi:hypothetical protein